MLKKHSAVKKNTHSEESSAEFGLEGRMGIYLKEKSHSMALHSKTHKLMFIVYRFMATLEFQRV